MFFDIVEDPEIEFSGDSKVLFTSSLLLLTNFCFNYYLDNNLTTFFLISMPLWISLLFYFLSENIRKIPLQDDVQKMWGQILFSDGTKYIKNTDITKKRFTNLYINVNEKDDELIDFEYECYKKNFEIFAYQISNKDMIYFPNGKFILSNGKIVNIKVSDWLSRCVNDNSIYVIEDNALRNTYISEEKHKILDLLNNNDSSL